MVPWPIIESLGSYGIATHRRIIIIIIIIIIDCVGLLKYVYNVRNMVN
jgi:hypothetical protein